MEAAEDQAWLTQSDQTASDRYAPEKLSKGLVAEPVERRYGDQITYLSTAAPEQPQRSRSKDILERARAKAEAARQGQNPVAETEKPPAEAVPVISDAAAQLASGPSPTPLAAVSEPIVPEPTVAEPAVPELAVLEPAVSEPAVPEPIAPEPIASEPIASEAIIAETAVAEPTVSARAGTEADLLAPEDVRQIEELPAESAAVAAPVEPLARTATEAELLAPRNVRQIEELPVESAAVAAPAEPLARTATEADLLAPANVRQIEELPVENPVAAAASEPRATVAAVERPAPSTEAQTLPRFRVQLAALASEPAATEEWQRLQGAYPDVLGSLNLVLDEVVLNGNRGVYLRVQASDFASVEEARAACVLLKSRGQNCFVVLP